MKTLKRRFSLLSLALSLLLLFAPLAGCTSQSEEKESSDNSTLIYGADVSWCTEMEASGIRFKTSKGKETECMALMKDLGIGAIRLRLWVHPTDPWNGLEDVMAKAKRAQSQNLDLMLDIHYSDTWADPGHQTLPEAWKDLTREALIDTVGAYTSRVLRRFNAEGIYFRWIQIGNEVSDGMLWPWGKASEDMETFSKLFQAGYRGAKTVCPDSEVMIHFSDGKAIDHITWALDGLKSYGAVWDGIGLSLYPIAETPLSIVAGINATIANVQTLHKKYDCPITICEFGMPVSDPKAADLALQSLIDGLKPLSYCEGVFWWEPESSSAWKNYDKGAFSTKYKPTKALNSFKK